MCWRIPCLFDANVFRVSTLLTSSESLGCSPSSSESPNSGLALRASLSSTSGGCVVGLVNQCLEFVVDSLSTENTHTHTHIQFLFIFVICGTVAWDAGSSRLRPFRNSWRSLSLTGSHRERTPGPPSCWLASNSFVSAVKSSVGAG